MKSVSYNEAKKLADEMVSALECPMDFVVRKRARIILVQHGDGSRLEFHSACFRRIYDDWIVIFTEHHGTFVYHVEDVDYVREYLDFKSLYYNKDN